jgi:NADH-quinone oxidoreductase subunit J
METAVFLVAAVVILTGAIGVIASRNPVHSALMLVMTLFGVAVLFVAQDAHFLAAVQVIVYAGAIVVLFLFVIMLLGVDRAEDLGVEPLAGQRPAAAVVAVMAVGLLATLAVRGAQVSLGASSVVAPLDGDGNNIEQLGRALFTNYLFAFEATSVLLIIGVVGAVVLARRPARRFTIDPLAPSADQRAGDAATDEQGSRP